MDVDEVTSDTSVGSSSQENAWRYAPQCEEMDVDEVTRDVNVAACVSYVS